MHLKQLTEISFSRVVEFCTTVGCGKLAAVCLF
jgi:hypothetical protein